MSEGARALCERLTDVPGLEDGDFYASFRWLLMSESLTRALKPINQGIAKRL